MTPEELKLIDDKFVERYEDANGRVYIDQDNGTILCELLKPYVSIEGMMQLLKQITNIVELYGCRKLVLDERLVTGFHQPTMEWIYLTWKVEMYHRYHLTSYRHLFNQEPWFLKCVDAGWAAMRKKEPNSVLHVMDVKSCNSLADALAN